jgi:uncharacterized membrane protein YhaH (DUF805 family)
MNNKYLNLSNEIQNYIDFAISDGELTQNEIDFIKRKAIEYGDDPVEVELVLSKIISEIKEKRENEILQYEETIPNYGFIDSVILAFKNYANFKGRSSRSQFWYFILFNYLLIFTVFVIIGIKGEAIGDNETNSFLLGLFILLFPLFSFIPFLSICTRRMHDINKSGWNILIPIYNIILLCSPGNQENNKFGLDPYQKIKVEKKPTKDNFFSKIKTNTIETIGGTMFAMGATSHEAIELKIIDFHELDSINKWFWIIGGILIVIPKTYNFLSKKNQ